MGDFRFYLSQPGGESFTGQYAPDKKNMGLKSLFHRLVGEIREPEALRDKMFAFELNKGAGLESADIHLERRPNAENAACP